MCRPSDSSGASDPPGPNSEMPNPGIEESGGKCPDGLDRGLDRRIVNNLHDFCGAGGRTLSASMQGF